MKFAIVSDTHDNLKNFQKVITWLNKQNIAIILHCGDICFREILEGAQKNFHGKMYWVRGNGDYNLDEIPEELKLEIGGRKIFLVHYPDRARRAAESGDFDLVFYGHTHKPWEEKIGRCRLINPGEIAGQRLRPTFAIYDTDTDFLELKIIDAL